MASGYRAPDCPVRGYRFGSRRGWLCLLRRPLRYAALGAGCALTVVPRSTQPCFSPGWLNRVPVLAGVRVGISPLPVAGNNTVWSRMACEFPWRRVRVALPLRTAIPCLPTAWLLNYRPRQKKIVTRATYASAVLAMAIVHIYVCLSEVYILSKHLDGSSWFLSQKLLCAYPTL